MWLLRLLHLLYTTTTNRDWFADETASVSHPGTVLELSKLENQLERRWPTEKSRCYAMLWDVGVVTNPANDVVKHIQQPNSLAR